MNVTNHYEEEGAFLANGTLGVVRRVCDRHSLDVEFSRNRTWRFTTRPREGGGDLDLREHLRPAYALTVHKFQGSEARRVVGICEGWFPSRNWLYTCMTRGRARCDLLDVEGRAVRACVLTPGTARITRLKERLAPSSPCV